MNLIFLLIAIILVLIFMKIVGGLFRLTLYVIVIFLILKLLGIL